MKPKLLWTDPGLPPRGEDKIKATVYSLTFRPDGTQIVVAVSNLVLVYNTEDGDLVHRLRGHKDTVYSVDYSKDGLRFASGGADKTVIIWNAKGEGVLKFTHNESIQVVSYNPTTEQLSSCTATDFGMWSREQKSVTKHKVYSKILCAKWTNDGQYIALGMYNGHVQIREKNGDEYKVIEKPAPVWCLSWSPSRDEPCDVLAVGCWNQTVSFYQLSGTPHLKERRVHFYPCALDYFASGEFMVIGGSDQRASLCTREAVRLATVCELDSEEWVWSLGVRPRTPGVCVGSQGGAISMWDLAFDACYAIEAERFAVREHMTDVVVHHMTAEKRVRIKSRDYVKNVAIYKQCLAIQLPDRINVYELHRRVDNAAPAQQDSAQHSKKASSTAVDMHYKLRKDRIYYQLAATRGGAGAGNNKKKSSMREAKRAEKAKKAALTKAAAAEADDSKRKALEEHMEPISFLGVTARHVLLAEGKKVQLHAFTADPVHVEREWVFDAAVTCLVVDGGPAGKEGVLVGLEDGSVSKVYVDNPFPMELVARTGSSVRSVRVSRDRDQLALINDAKTLYLWTDLLGGSSSSSSLAAAAKTSSSLLGGGSSSLTAGVKTMLTATTAELTVENVAAVAFNDDLAGMLCYTKAGGGEEKNADQFIRLAGHPVQQHHVKGTVVGFVGSKLFVKAGGGVTVVDVPLTALLNLLINAKQFPAAFRIAAVGVTADDWRTLAEAAAANADFTTARAAYARIRDLRSIELLDSMETRRHHAKASGNNSFLHDQSGIHNNKTATNKRGPAAATASRRRGRPGDPPAAATSTKAEGDPALMISTELEPLFQAELLAHKGCYQEAAQVYTRAGHVQLAIDLFADLRQWEEAKLFAASSADMDTRELVRRQAEWAEDVEDWAAAAEMYVTAGDPMRAVKLLGEHQDSGGRWADLVAKVGRSLDVVNHRDVLRTCAKYFLGAGLDDRAREVYEKLGDTDALVAIYVRKQQWDEAIKLAESLTPDHPHHHDGAPRSAFDQSLFLPYAEWLALHDRFDEALAAYRKSGRPDEASKMMEQLTFNAVVESRFDDAAYYYWLLASELLRSVAAAGGADAVRVALPQYQEYLLKADLYYAYHRVESYFLPFSELRPEVLFQVARFIVNSLGAKDAPHGISRAKVLYTLAKQAKLLGAYKLARFAYDKLQHMKVPEGWTDELEVDMLLIHAKSVRDNPEVLPVCYRCGATNALLNPAGTHATKHPYQAIHAHCDVCTSCGHPFVRSFINFEILPLVEFLPEPGLSDDDARELIREAPPDTMMSGKGRLVGARSSAAAAASRYNPNEHKMGEANVMAVDDDDGDDDEDNDLFGKAINRTLSTQEGVNSYVSVTVDAKTLRSLNREEVFCCQPRAPGMRATFYKSALPDCHLAISQSCHRFFHEDDFEFAVLRDKRCPYSRVPADDIGDFGPC